MQVLSAKIEGIEEKDGRIEVRGERSEKLLAKLRSGGRGQFEVQVRRKAYEPTAAEKARVEAAATDTEGLAYFEAVAAQTYLDRQDDVLSRGFLQAMAAQYEEGRAILDGHDWKYRIGYTFAAEVRPVPNDAQNFELAVRFYVPQGAKMAGGNEAQMELKTGIVRNVSVSFAAPFRYIAENAPDNALGREYFLYDTPPSPELLTVYELSTVVLGAQQGAGVRKTAQNGPTIEVVTLQEKPGDMETKEVKAGDLTLKVSAESEAAVRALVAERDRLHEELKPYREAEKQRKQEAITKAVNLNAQIFKAEPEKEKARLEKLDISEIEAEIARIASLKVAQTKPEEGQEEKKDYVGW